MKQSELKVVLESHSKWLKDECGSRADLSGAYLSRATLDNVIINEHTAFFTLQCPEEGSFIGWKKCRNNVLVKLLITDDAKRSSATSSKCRASKVIVDEVIGAEYGISKHDPSVIYRKGEIVEVDNFDEDRWNECSYGIHFFMSKELAKQYD